MRDCGSCAYFIKWKNNKICGGLCDFFEIRTKTNHGKACEYWAGIKYQRQQLGLESKDE